VIVNIDKETYAASHAALEEAGRDRRHVHIRADICDADAMRAAFATWRPEVVMHLAAESHVDRSIDGPAEFIRTNVLGTGVVLEAARAHWAGLEGAERAAFRFHHISTDEVFGSLESAADKPFDAQTPYDPRSPYSASKAASDHLVRAWWHTYGFPAFVSNTTNNYGPWQFPEKLIPLVALNALEGRTLPVYGDGSNVRDWLHVDDHAEALCLAALGAGGRAGPTASGRGRSGRTCEVVRAICAVLDRLRPDPAGPRERLISFVRDRPGARFPLRDGPVGRGGRARVAGAARLRGRAGGDAALVPRPRGVVGADPRAALRRTAPRAGADGDGGGSRVGLIHRPHAPRRPTMHARARRRAGVRPRCDAPCARWAAIIRAPRFAPPLPAEGDETCPM
jgi:dTDP-glucose 4,6-dehydratase